MKLTAKDLLKLGVIDEIISEPLGGAHRDRAGAFAIVQSTITTAYEELKDLSHADLVTQRMDKYAQMGVYKEQ